MYATLADIECSLKSFEFYWCSVFPSCKDREDDRVLEGRGAARRLCRFSFHFFFFFQLFIITMMCSFYVSCESSPVLKRCDLMSRNSLLKALYNGLAKRKKKMVKISPKNKNCGENNQNLL